MQSIAAFPVPYPNELMYSLFSRHLARSRYAGPATPLIKRWTGRQPLSLFMILPFGLGKLCRTICCSDWFSVDNLISQRTVYPYIEAFLDPDYVEPVRRALIGHDPVFTAGVPYSRLLEHGARRLQFCRQCVADDRRLYGEAYWHREHQVSGALVCVRHRVWLEPTTIGLRERDPNAHLPFRTLEWAMAQLPRRSQRGETLISTSGDFALRLAENCNYILEHGWRMYGEELSTRFLRLTYEHGLTNYLSRTLKSHEAYVAYFRKKIPRQILEKLSFDLQSFWRVRHLQRLVGLGKPLPTLDRLIALQALETSIETFTHSSPELPPFGLGPWACLNRASDHFGQPLISTIRVEWNQKTSRHHGEFTCPSCGYAYQRKAPESGQESHHHYPYVLRYGPVWETAVRMRLQAGECIHRVASDLHSDRRTVQRLLNQSKRGVELAGWQAADRRPAKKPVAEKRAEFLDIKRRYQRSALIDEKERQRRVAVMNWLRRYDRSWYLAHAYQLPRRLNVRWRKGIELRWTKMDAKLASDIREIVLLEKTKQTRPNRISQSLIDRVLRHKLWALFAKYPNALPEANKEWHKALESRSDYLRRLVQWGIRRCRAEGVVVHWYQFASIIGCQRGEVKEGEARRLVDKLRSGVKKTDLQRASDTRARDQNALLLGSQPILQRSH